MTMDAVSLLSESRRERPPAPAESSHRERPQAPRSSHSERPDSGRRSERTDPARPQRADDDQQTFNDHLPAGEGAPPAPLATTPPAEVTLPNSVIPGGALAALLAGNAAIDLAAAVGDEGSGEAELLASLGLMIDEEGRLQPLPSEQNAHTMMVAEDGEVPIEEAGQRAVAPGQPQATDEEGSAAAQDPRLALAQTTESKRSTTPKEQADTEAPRLQPEQTHSSLPSQSTANTQASTQAGNQPVAEWNGDQPMTDRRLHSGQGTGDAGQIERLLAPNGNAANEAAAARQMTQLQSAAPTATHWTQSLEEVETAMDRALAQQIGRAVLSETNEQQRVLTMRLTPPELGTVRIQFVEQGGQLHLRLNAEDDGVRAALERAIPTLRQELRSGNGNVVDVQLTDQFLQFQEQQQERPGAETGTGDGRHRNRRGGAVFSLDGAAAETDPSSTPGRRQPDAQALVDTSV